MSAVAIALSELLRAETAAHHKNAEGKVVQQTLLKGSVTRGQYGAWLGEMLLIHEELAAAVRAAERGDARARRGEECDAHGGRLRRDLAGMGASADGAGLPATRTLVARMRAASPCELIGMQYVLEGSMNGNKYIAMGVRRGLGLQPGTADAYLDPYGERQRGVWAEFKMGLDRIEMTEDERAAAVEGARVMFDGIAGMNEELGAGWR